MDDSQRKAYEDRRRKRDAYYDAVEALQADAKARGLQGDLIWADADYNRNRVSIPVDLLAQLMHRK